MGAKLTTRNSFDRRYVYLISSVTAIAGLLFGFDIAVINGALVYLREAFHLTDRQTEIAASSLIFGCIFGTAATGTLTDRYGRRPLLAFAALLFGLSSLGAGLVTFPRTRMLANSDKEVTWNGSLPKAHLWSVRDPFLYDARIAVGSDEITLTSAYATSASWEQNCN